jgi:hypothetical protein
VIALSQGALWKHRTPDPKQNLDPSPLPEQTAIIEYRILGHLFDVHQVLLEVAIQELEDLPAVKVSKLDLAHRITMAFKYILPALRIASKWLKANIKYLTTDSKLIAYQATEKIGGTDPSSVSHNDTSTLWKKWAEFLTVLSHTFPEERLPSLTEPLEEDIDFRGFVPLEGLMFEAKTMESDTLPAPPSQAQDVHPDVMELMRISDLLQDANELADDKVWSTSQFLCHQCLRTDVPSCLSRTLPFTSQIIYFCSAIIQLLKSRSCRVKGVPLKIFSKKQQPKIHALTIQMEQRTAV